MGIVGSKDESGKVVLGALPPGFLDYRGRELRDKLDACLEKNMWFFSIGGIILSVPVCIKYKTERPLMAAAITCPVMDMMFGTIRCDKEKEEFAKYYKQLQGTWNEQAGRHDAGGAAAGGPATEQQQQQAQAQAQAGPPSPLRNDRQQQQAQRGG